MADATADGKAAKDPAGKAKGGASKGRAKGSVDLYGLMHVERNATEKEIRKAYFAMALKVHPDKNLDDPSAVDNFKALQEAYEILKDPIKRKHYDRTGAVGEEQSSSFWQAYERYKTVEISEHDIQDYLSKFHGSAQEERDLMHYFVERSGDMTTILAHIIGSKDEDIPRFVAFFEAAIASGKVEDDNLVQRFLETKDSIHTIEQLEGSEEIDSESDGDEDGGGENDVSDGEDGEEEDDDDDDFIASEDSEGEGAARAGSGDEDQDDGDDLEGVFEAGAQGRNSDHEDGDEEDEDDSPPLKFQVGQAVDARWRKGPKYFRGVVLEADPSARKYKIEFDDDGYVEDGVAEAHVRVSKIKASSKAAKRKSAAATKPAKSPSGPNPKRKKSEPSASVEAEYDGDLAALRAAMLSRGAQRSRGMDEFEARWAGK